MREEYLQQEKFLNQKKEVLQVQQNEDQTTILESEWINDLLEHKGLKKLDRDTVIQFIDQIRFMRLTKREIRRLR